MLCHGESLAFFRRAYGHAGLIEIEAVASALTEQDVARTKYVADAAPVLNPRPVQGDDTSTSSEITPESSVLV